MQHLGTRPARKLAATRRRLRLAWLVSVLQGAAPLLGILAVAAALMGWLLDWTWALPVVGILAAVGLMVAVVAAMTLRIADSVVARAADRGLGLPDTIATALEVPDTESGFGAILHRRAVTALDRARPRRMVALTYHPRRMGLSVALVACALGLAALTTASSADPAGASRGRFAEDADTVRELAEEVEEEPNIDEERRDEIQRILEDLASTLESAPSPERATEAVDIATAEVAATKTLEGLSRRAAVHGLDQTLAQSPLSPGGGSTEEQLAEIADGLDELSAEELAELADRLEALAATQNAGNPELAESLRDAAGAIRSGDLASAAGHLDASAEAQAAARRADSGERAIEGLLSRLKGLGNSVAGAGDSTGNGQGDGDGDGEGQGEGDGQGQAQGQGQGDGDGDGEGQGQGDGQGQAQGQGQGQGQSGTAGGSPSGQIGNVDPSGNNPSGQGGQGSPAPGQESETGDTPPGQERTIFDDPANAGEQVQVQLEGGEGSGEVVGQGQGPTQTGAATIPLADALPGYLDQASRNLDQLDIPPALRDLVRNYFDALARGS